MDRNSKFFKKLWSSKSISHQQPPISSSKTPAFKVSNFEDSSSPSSGAESSSSFYTGKVQYGGAMSASRSRLGSPYVIPTVKNKNSKIINVSAGRKNEISLEKRVSGALSSTARKILQTLEKMAAPLSEHKRNASPSSKRPSSSLLASTGMQQKQSIESTPVKITKRIHSPSTNFSLQNQSSVSASPNIPLDDNSVTQSLLKNISCGVQKIDSSSPTVNRGKSAIFSSLSSSIGLKSKTSNVGGPGGKMRIPRKSTAHYSNTPARDENFDAPDLPDIPITISSLPKFNFYKQEINPAPILPKPSTYGVNDSTKEPDDPLELTYKFSVPGSLPSGSKVQMVKKSSVKFQTTSRSNGPKFQVRPPGHTFEPSSLRSNSPSKARTNSSCCRSPERTKSDRSPPKQRTSPELERSGTNYLSRSSGTCRKRRTPERSKCCKQLTKPFKFQPRPTSEKSNTDSVAAVLARQPKSPEASEIKKKSESNSENPQIVPLADVFKKSEDTWECPTCLIKNKNEDSRCVACQSPKPLASTPLVTDNANKWTCDVCLVKNDNARSTCAACQSPKPGTPPTVPSQEKPNLSKWECEVCLVRNSADRETCEACQSPKPGLKPLSEVKSAVMSKWQCDTCLIYNNPEDKTCAACEAPKPGSNVSPSLTEVASKKRFSNVGTFSSTSASQKFAFGFGSKQSSPGKKVAKWTCDTCLVQNDLEKTTCIACGAPKPGLQSTNPTAAPVSSSFKFGNTSSSVFQFGIPSTKTETSPAQVETKITESSAVVNTSSAQVKFGVSDQSQKNESLPSFLPSTASQAVSFQPNTQVLPNNTASTQKPSFSFGYKPQIDSGTQVPSNTQQKVSSVGSLGEETIPSSITTLFTASSQAGSAFDIAKSDFSNSTPSYNGQSEADSKTRLPFDPIESPTGSVRLPYDNQSNASLMSGFPSGQSQGNAPLSFGSANANNQPKSSPTIENSQQKPKTFFGFGTQPSVEAPTQTGFTGFGATQSASLNKDTSSGFSFGSSSYSNPQSGSGTLFGSATSNPPPQAAGFSFGSSNPTGFPQTQQASAFGTPQTTTNSGFGFGSSSNQTSTPTFQFGSTQNNSNATPTGGFSFGNPDNSNHPAPSAGLHLGLSNQITNKQTAPSVPSEFKFGSDNQGSGFVFGGSKTSQPPQFGQNNSANSTASTAFNIGQGSSAPPSRVFKQAKRRIKPFSRK